MRAIVQCSLILAFMLAAGLVRGEELRIFRPSKAGDRYTVTAAATLNEKMLVLLGNNPPQKRDKEQEIDFAAKAEVIAINKMGRPSKIEYTIERFNTASKENTEALLKPGQVVVAETKDNRRVFSLKEGELPREAQIVLSLVLGLSDSKYSEDELFNTKNAKGTNSSWEANPAVLADEFKAAKLKLSKDDINSAFKTAPAPKGYPADAVQIIGEIKLNNAVPPLPSGMQLKQATGSITYAWVLPTDPSKHILGEIRASKMANEINGKTPDNQDMMMNSEIDQKIEIRYDSK